MPDTSLQRIQYWQRKWRVQALCLCSLLALGSSLLIITVLHLLLSASWWWAVPVLAITLGIALVVYPQWRITHNDITQYLNRQEPALEESSDLLLLTDGPLTLMQQLQAARIKPVLQQLQPVSPLLPLLKKAAAFFAGALLLSLLITRATGKRQWTSHQGAAANTTQPVTEKLLPGIASVTVTIQPPAYIHQPARRQQQFNIKAEEGAAVTWSVHTTQPVTMLQLKFNDSSQLVLHAADSSHTQWQAGTTISKSGFYQVQLQQQVSEFYKIEIIKDQPPVISVQSPAAHSVIDYGMPEQVPLRLHLADDYGITGAVIIATVASGSGEAVKFKEQQLVFHNNFAAHDTAYRLQQTLDLAALQMHPGDELYFYIKATDTHEQQTRSDIFIVTLPDTAQLMSLDGIVSGVDLKPEYFRSQRQIIIETEQLIRNQASLTPQAFKDKSNDLGSDQKLLRLRYGKFLGEESETHIGDSRAEAADSGHHAHEDDHDHATSDDPKDFNNAAKILDAFSHKHDIAEDATFFDPETKKQLKATLAEMWNAELQLRTFKPRDALPYEYKALRLLKDLQQKSRSYVGKTSAKTTPLKPEKRLTGELDKIVTPVVNREVLSKTDSYAVLRNAISILDQLKTTATLSVNGKEVLQQTIQQLGKAAASQPAAYLSAYEALQRIVQLQQHVRLADISVTEKALHQLLPSPDVLPSAASPSGMPGLSQQYFNQLKPGRHP